MTSNAGFSVVAPISVIRPSSTAGSTASCCALLKRWISSRKRIVRWPCAPSRSRARAITSRTCETVADTAESSSNAAPVMPATILAGEGPSDYERYLRTDELLALQKTPEERIHRDELLFQTVHQSSELWLKHACAEVATATDCVREGVYEKAERLLRRAQLAAHFITDQLEMLEQLSPWEYQTVRRVLGH